MENVWGHRTVQSLSSKEKDEILNAVFEACMENEELCDIGGEIVQKLCNKNYIWSEETED